MIKCIPSGQECGFFFPLSFPSSSFAYVIQIARWAPNSAWIVKGESLQFYWDLFWDAILLQPGTKKESTSRGYMFKKGCFPAERRLTQQDHLSNEIRSQPGSSNNQLIIRNS